MEFVIKSSPYILFEFLSTTSGLAQWFADDVNIYHNYYIFKWDSSKERAKIIDQSEDKFIRFQWDNSPKEEFFEFRIETTEITGDTVLLITDFAYEKDLTDAHQLWESQVHELKKRLGGL